MTLLMTNAGLLAWLFAALLVLRWFHVLVTGAQVEAPPSFEKAEERVSGQLSSPPHNPSPAFMADKGRILTAHS